MCIKRQSTLAAGGTSLPLPAFFPSISSVKTNLPPVEYLDFLVSCGHPNFLISAYDIANVETHKVIPELLSQAVKSEQIVLMDSGNYESFWKADVTWNVQAFHTILSSAPHHLSFAYDNQMPPDEPTAIAQDVTAGALRDQEKSATTVIPIVHGAASVLPEVVRCVGEQLFPIMIAVPERALGNGILQRTATVREIRLALNETGIYIPLHLLGTGNPVSLLIYALAGADSFDGLEWCQTVIDHSSGRLHHFQHWDFFADQCNFNNDAGVPYAQSVLLHNLAFYNRFLAEIRDNLTAGKSDALARQWLADDSYKKIIPILEGRRV